MKTFLILTSLALMAISLPSHAMETETPSNPIKQNSLLLGLPSDILREIVLYLPAPDLGRFASVSKATHKAVKYVTDRGMRNLEKSVNSLKDLPSKEHPFIRLIQKRVKPEDVFKKQIYAFAPCGSVVSYILTRMLKRLQEVQALSRLNLVTVYRAQKLYKMLHNNTKYEGDPYTLRQQIAACLPINAVYYQYGNEDKALDAFHKAHWDSMVTWIKRKHEERPILFYREGLIDQEIITPHTIVLTQEQLTSNQAHLNQMCEDGNEHVLQVAVWGDPEGSLSLFLHLPNFTKHLKVIDIFLDVDNQVSSGSFSFFGSLQTLDLSSLNMVSKIGPNFLSKCRPYLFSKSTGLQYVDLSSFTNVHYIGSHFLSESTGVQYVDLSSFTKVDSIESHFLYGCTGLKNVDLSSFTKVYNIESYFLSRCTGLQYVDLSSFTNVWRIGSYFLYDCTSLQYLDLRPLSNVSQIGSSFLFGCTNLKTLYLNKDTSLYKVIEEKFSHLLPLIKSPENALTPSIEPDRKPDLAELSEKQLD